MGPIPILDVKWGMAPLNEDRIEALESKVAYLELGNQELSDVLYRQQQLVDALAARLERLTERLKSLEEQPRGYTEQEEAPPHY